MKRLSFLWNKNRRIIDESSKSNSYVKLQKKINKTPKSTYNSRLLLLHSKSSEVTLHEEQTKILQMVTLQSLVIHQEKEGRCCKYHCFRAVKSEETSGSFWHCCQGQNVPHFAFTETLKLSSHSPNPHTYWWIFSQVSTVALRGLLCTITRTFCLACSVGII